MTLDFFEKLNQNVARFPDRVVFQNLTETERETFTYRQVAEEAAAMAAHLAREGVRPGERVGILMETHPRWGMAFLAAQSAGAVVVPLDTLHETRTLAGLIQHAGCSFIVVSERLTPLWREIQSLLDGPLPYLIAGARRAESGGGKLPLVERNLDDELIILYTSGTTGDPKGVVLSGRNVYRNVVEVIKMVGPTPDDHFLNVLPLYHVLALVVYFIVPLYLGARVTFLQSLEAQKILKTFREEGISIFICVPQFFYLVHRRILQEVERQGFLKKFLFRRLLAVSRFANLRLGLNPGRLFFAAIHRQFGPRLRLIGVGGARFDSEIAESFRDLGFSMLQAFGMTETAALTTVALAKSHAVGTAGVPLPHVEIRIDGPDESGAGEVLVRGENVMLGYYKNPEATAEALKDGWLHTGDLGYVDARGYLHITGRMKDVIVLSSGKNIYPEEIERFYQSGSPSIKEICVVGVPDEEGERLHAVVVPDFEALKSREVVNSYDAIRYEMESLSERLPGYRRVLSLEIRQEPLPRTTTRKIKRFEVQREVLGRRAKGVAEAVDAQPETPVEERLFAMIRALKDAPAINPSMNLELDLGLTSLERVELLSAIQGAFGARILEEDAAKLHTVGDLVEAVERFGGGAAGSAGETLISWGSILRAPLDSEEARIAEEILRPRLAFELLRHVLSKFVRLAAGLLLRFDFAGIEHFPPPPFLICPNHNSYLDAFLIMGALPFGVSRRMFFLGEAMYFEGPVMGKVARWLKVVALSPDRAVRFSLRLAAEGLGRGLVLCVFPEGERSIDGSLKAFRKGPSIVATEMGLPVVPASIRGTWEVWRRGSNRLRLHPVAVAFGAALAPSGKSADEFNVEMHEAVQRLL